ncbi:MAG: MFS transporter, partial [Actinomycetota bacterium]|nr:MFS transporter [Actinomycetota bacterium]
MTPRPGEDRDRSVTTGRWLLVGAVAGVYASFGVVNASLAPLIDPVRRDLGLSLSSMGVVLGAWQFVYLLTAVPAGAVLDRFGTTRAIAVGGALVALSGFGRAAADGLGGLLVAVGLFGVGGPLISIGAPKLVRSHFDDRSRGPAMGVVAAAPGVGATLALVTANSVLMARTGSWRATMATFAGVAALACLLWLAASWWADTSPRRRARAVPASDDAGRGDRGRDLPSSRRSDRNHDELAAADTAEEEDGRDRDGPVAAALALLRVRRVRRLLAAVAGTFFVVHAMSNWVVEMLRSFGAGAELASLGAAVLSLVGVVAALTLPSLTAPERRAVVL